MASLGISIGLIKAAKDHSGAVIEDPPDVQFPFMNLPYEIRHRVLEFVVEPRNIRVFLSRSFKRPPTTVPLPSISSVRNRQVQLESILVALKQQTIEIHSGPGNEKLQAWLRKLDFTPIADRTTITNGFGAVHSLCFAYLSRFPHNILPAMNPNNDIELMLHCPNLRKVGITFVIQELKEPCGNRVKALSQLRKEYRLSGMLGLSNLRSLVVKGPARNPTERD